MIVRKKLYAMMDIRKVLMENHVKNVVQVNIVKMGQNTIVQKDIIVKTVERLFVQKIVIAHQDHHKQYHVVQVNQINLENG